MCSIPWHPGVNLVGSDEKWGLLAISKPIDLLSHPNRENSVAVSAIVQSPYLFKEECYLLKDGRKLFLLNRLDSPTSGLLLLTASEQTAKKINVLFAERKVFKEYTALVKGSMPEKCLWKDSLKIAKTPRSQLRSKFSEVGGLTAITEVFSQEKYSFDGVRVSQIALQPKTGRTHQLRVQCASHGHPILGDRTYGDFALNRKLKLKRLYLHATKITLKLGNEVLEFLDPPELKKFFSPRE